MQARGPLGSFEHACSLCLRARGQWAFTVWAASVPVVLIGPLWIHAERVGWGLPSWLWAAVGLLAWWCRCRGLAEASVGAAERLWPSSCERTGAAVSGLAEGVASLALASRLLVGLLPFALSALLGGWLAGPLGVVVGASLGVVRGAMGPSWPVEAGRAPAASHRALAAARRLQRGRRWHALAVETLLFGGWVALALDATLVLAFGGSWLRSVFGLEVSLGGVDRLRHPMVLATAASIAFWLLEPLRAAVAASSWVDARVRRDALDVRARVRRALGIAAWLLLVSLPGPLAAQGGGSERDRDADAEMSSVGPGWDAADVRVYRLSQRILRAPDFGKGAHGGQSGALRETLDAWVLRWWNAWTRRPVQAPRGPSSGLAVSGFQGSGWWLSLVALLLFASGLLLWLASRWRGRRDDAAERGEATRREGGVDSRRREAWPEEVEAALAAGKPIEALRVVYRALLEELDRSGVLRFDPHLPNGLLVRRAPKGEVKELLVDLTGLFDRACYGGETPTAERVREAVRVVRGVTEALAARRIRA